MNIAKCKLQNAKCETGEPTVHSISAFLNKTLRIRLIKDASLNGLQVPSRKRGNIRKVGFAVDACLSTFQKAKELGVDLLVVHHGIKWRPQKDRDLELRRAAWLKKNNLALYAAHLPLDLHGEYGNNIRLCRILGLRNTRKFGRYHGIKIGYSGTFEKAKKLYVLESVLNRTLATTCRVVHSGKDRIHTLGIVSGGGGGMLKEAVQEKLDCFLVGEIDLAVYNAAREYNINLIVAGHYASETLGVKALMPVVGEAFGIETVFVEDPKDL